MKEGDVLEAEDVLAIALALLLEHRPVQQEYGRIRYCSIAEDSSAQIEDTEGRELGGQASCQKNYE